MEPGEFCWKFGREGSRCTVQVVRNNENAPAFSAEDGLLHFSSEVENSLQKLVDEWSEQCYLEKWGHPFPEKSHRKLVRLINRERKSAEGTPQTPD